MTSEEFRRVVDAAYESCRRNGDKAWILEPYEGNIISGTEASVFKGIIFGTSSSPLPGCAFQFDLQIDGGALADPPRVTFGPGLFHPLIDAHGHFCFPAGQASSVSCRTDSLEKIMEVMIKLFFLDKSQWKDTGAANCVNPEARTSFMKTRVDFWKKLEKRGCLGGNKTPEEGEE
jgi:ubiquitin-protein ligase